MAGGRVLRAVGVRVRGGLPRRLLLLALRRRVVSKRESDRAACCFCAKSTASRPHAKQQRTR